MDVKNEHGWTALVWASRNGHADVVNLLLDAGGYPLEHITTET